MPDWMAPWQALRGRSDRTVQAMAVGQPGAIHARLSLAHPGFELDVDLQLPGKGVTVLFGPSGCGKTTVLRALAGLGLARGRVALPDEVWQDDAQGVWRPTHQRAMAYVFQEASLFPHLSVRDNLDYGRRRVPPAQRRITLDEAAAMLGIAHLLARSPEALSGGERQRVAIARALLTSPRLLLMDEPLSALDAARKAEILPYLERLNREAGVPVVYVTHAIDEAARLADHLVLLEAGRVKAAGPVAELLSRLDLMPSQVDEAAAVIDATVVGHDEAFGQSQLDLAGWPFWVGISKVPAGQRVRARVLARDVSVALSQARDSSILHILPCTIVALRDDGVDRVTLQLRVQPASEGAVSDDARPLPLLLARLTRRSVAQLQLVAGQTVFAQVKGAALIA
jgi:molybdate transport system ATP-binding protein